MAINYKKEWYKFKHAYEDYAVCTSDGYTRMKDLMDRQINNTIQKREKLMKEYIKEEMLTDIVGANQTFHFVKVDTQWGTFGNIAISRKDFDAWCKEKEKEENEL